MTSSTVVSASFPFTGGSFLIDAAVPDVPLFPEDLSDEQRDFQRTVRRFIEGDVATRLEELDKLDGKLAPGLLKQLAELGFFQAEIPEDDGGLGLGLFATLAMIEELGRGGSFHVAAMVHQGIGTQPIAYYGNEEQRCAYLPDAMEGKRFGAYALTEPGSGSDALGMKTTAVTSDNGATWVLNGSKQFITNAAWASYFVVFAKIDGDKVTGFIIDRDTPGFEVTAEEHKMGIKGSSTCGLRLTNVMVPASAMLGEIGIGHKIALNLLNLGRLKLGTTVLGADKAVVRQAIQYACERKQFNTRIADFGMSRQKLAECAALIIGGEAVAYRTAGLIQAAADRHPDGPTPAAKIGAADTFSPECAMVKVYLSEGGCTIADHAVQLLGGYGFIEEYPTARAYRDARIARLYEGTNEINRLHMVTTILRRATTEGNDLSSMDWLGKLKKRTSVSKQTSGAARQNVETLKDLFSVTLDKVLEKVGGAKGLRTEQEAVWHLADLMIQTFVADSVAARWERVLRIGAKRGVWTLGEAPATVAIGRAIRQATVHASWLLNFATQPGPARRQAMGRIADLTADVGSTLDADRAVAAWMVDHAEWEGE